jgi:hypothetical protein
MTCFEIEAYGLAYFQWEKLEDTLRKVFDTRFGEGNDHIFAWERPLDNGKGRF